MKVKSIPHIVLSVNNYNECVRFYKSLFIDHLGCTVKTEESDFFYFSLNSDDLSIGISEASTNYSLEVFNRYKAGLHHFALELETKDDIDMIYDYLLTLKAVILDKPTYYPEYGDNYYAVYFLDPSGLKHEFVAFN
jgi:catechol 2,3-dioxygenase-like lactoylglutathione lyase family enzyme